MTRYSPWAEGLDWDGCTEIMYTGNPNSQMCEEVMKESTSN